MAQLQPIEEFDLHAGIRTLAEATQPCQNLQHGIINDLAFPKVVVPTPCHGTGRIVPFAALRVECNPDSFDHQRGTCDCEGLGWIPEPDVRVACWEIVKILVERLTWAGLEPYDTKLGVVMEEAVVRAALAWVKEQHYG